jgi:hypothetical protein
MLHAYTPKDASTCLKDRSTVFVGDSIVRSLFFSFIHILDPNLPDAPPPDGHKHKDYHFSAANGGALSFLWDPFLNSSQTNDILGLSPPSSQPYLLVLGSGLWYLRYHNTSGGLAQWQTNTRYILQRISDRIPAQHLVLLPIEKLAHSKLSAERANTMNPFDIDAMNAELAHQISRISLTYSERPTSPPIIFPTVFNDLLDLSETEDGLHYGKTTVREQANILFNRICNEVLPKTYPLDKTCCRTYPPPSGMQSLLLLVMVAFGPLIYLLRRYKGLEASR